MNNKLLKKLRREATANPKKAAVLGVLLLVAIYFWLPLVSRWTRGSANQAGPPTVGAPTAPAPAPPVVPAATPAPTVAVANTKPEPAWQDVAAAIDADPRMRPAALETSTLAQPNPFGRPSPLEMAKPTSGPEGGAEVADDTDPAELGLVLSSTVVGAARKTAVINGKVYTPGREVPADDGIVFLLSDIQPRRIVLERAGREFELRIPQPWELK